MKTFNKLISEKLIINKNTKNIYEYTPKSKKELQKIIDKIVKESKDGNINLNNIDINNPNIDSLENLFAFNTKIHTLDVSAWDVSNIKNLDYTFYELENLEYINLTGWDIKNVTTMSGIFSSNFKLTTIKGIENWDVSNIIELEFVFEFCKNLKIDLSNWNINPNADTYHIVYKAPGVKLKMI